MASLDEQTYATNILLEKRARRLAEEDALRLYNRVRQLQKEEDKAARRIQDTKRKAKEIIKLRERNELLRQEKEARLAQLALEIERQKQDNLKLKEEIIRNKTEQENRIWADKVTVAQQTKEEKAEIEKLLAESKLLSRKEALEQKESVRRQQEEARRRIEQLKVNRLQMVSRVSDMHAQLAPEHAGFPPTVCYRMTQPTVLHLLHRLKMSMSVVFVRRWRPRQLRRQRLRSW
jgi:hypothetical protein